MFRNMIVIGLRNLWRNKLYSFINVLGLAVGLTASILVMILVQDELSYDQFHQHRDQIHRVSFQEMRDGNLVRYAKIPFPAKQVFLDNLPEVTSINRLYSNTKVGGPVTFATADHRFSEMGLFFTDPNFSEFFGFEWLAGDPATALTDDRSIVLTESMAIKYFGKLDVVDESMTVQFGNPVSLRVTGVIADLPLNTHMALDMLMPIEFLRGQWVHWYNYDFEKDWKWAGAFTYTKLQPGTSVSGFENRMQSLVAPYFADQDAETFELQSIPMTDIHLYSEYAGEMNPGGSIIQLYIIAALAIVILVVASVNFMNLATARSVRRAREVGIRKVMGASKSSLVVQFTGEAVIVSVMALVHCLLLINLILPVFNTFMDKEYTLSALFMNPPMIAGTIAVTLITGVLSGLYPAFFISSFMPSRALKSDYKVKGQLSIRQILVTVQFVVSIVFVLAVIVIQSQLSYVRQKDLGFEKDQIMIMTDKSLDAAEYRLWKNELEKNPHVLDTYLGHVPGKSAWTNTITPEGFEADDALSTSLLYTGYDVIDFFGLEIVSGRSFDRALDEDTVFNRSSFIINEYLAERLDWNENAVGKEIEWIGGNDNKTLIRGKVVGVVADFHQNSLFQPIGPLLMRLSDWGDQAIKFEIDQTEAVRNFAENTWYRLFPDKIFSYEYLDEELAKQYESEERLSQMISYFTVLAVIISCLGLFGLVAYIAENRKKEFAIRKTLGAEASQVVFLVLSNFSGLLVIAAVLALPIGWMMMNRWLDEFAYRITVGPQHFVLTITVCTIVAFATIIFQALKASYANPVDSLRGDE